MRKQRICIGLVRPRTTINICSENRNLVELGVIFLQSLQTVLCYGGIKAIFMDLPLTKNC